MIEFDKKAIKLFNDYSRTGVEIVCNFAEGDYDTLTIGERDLVQGSFSVDRYCATSKIEIGSAVASELKFKLNNDDGRFDKYIFEGSELEVWLTAKGKDETYRTKIGLFYIEDAPRRLTTMEFTALDRMRWFDQLVDVTFAANMTVLQYVDLCCSTCRVELKDETLTGCVNTTYKISELPSSDSLTYRALIQDLAAIMGTNAYIDENGKLVFAWYSDSVGETEISAKERYINSGDIYEKDITITGVYYSADDEEYLSGSDVYVLDLSSNDLLQSNIEAAIGNIASKVVGTVYRGFSADILPSPQLMPMDKVVYVDKNGERISTYVTGVTFNLNKSTSVEAVYESETSSKYYTPTQTKAMAAVEKEVKSVAKSVSYFEDVSVALSDLNSTLANALGLYVITEDNADGGTDYYFCDGSTFSDSTIIYTFNAAGFAWKRKGDSTADDWYDSTAWSNAITAEGNAFLNCIWVNKLTADYIDVQDIIVKGVFAYGNGDTSFSISSLGVEINSPYFLLTTEGEITATKGTIAEFEIDQREKAEEVIWTYSQAERYLTVTRTDETIDGEINTYFTVTFDFLSWMRRESYVTVVCWFSYTEEEEGEKFYESSTVTLTPSSPTATANPFVDLSGRRLDMTYWQEITNWKFYQTIIPHYIAYNKDEYDDTKAGVYIGSDGIGLGSSFYVKQTGDVYITKGTVGGLNVSANSLTNSDDTLIINDNGVTTNTLYVNSIKAVGDTSYSSGFVFNNTSDTETVRVTYSWTTASGAPVVTITTSSPLTAAKTFTVYIHYSAVFDDRNMSGIYEEREQSIEYQGTIGVGASSTTVTGASSITMSEASGTGVTMRFNYSPDGISYSVTSFTQNKYTSSYIISNQSIYPRTTGSYSLGASGYLWSAVYATNGTIQTSDRTAKHDIESLDEKYIALFDGLQPVRYKLNDGDGRYHTGFVAQDVETARDEAGLTADEFGAVVVEDNKRFLCYDEFIAVCVAKIKELEKTVKELKKLLGKGEE